MPKNKLTKKEKMLVAKVYDTPPYKKKGKNAMSRRSRQKKNEEMTLACLTYLKERDMHVTQDTLSRKTKLDNSQIRRALNKLIRKGVVTKPGLRYAKIQVNKNRPLTPEDKLLFDLPNGLTNISLGALAFYLAVLLYTEDHHSEVDSSGFLKIDSRDLNVVLHKFDLRYISDFGIQCEERGLLEIDRNKDPSYSYRILKEYSYDEILDSNEHPSISNTLSELLEDREQISLNLPAPRRPSHYNAPSKKNEAEIDEGGEAKKAVNLKDNEDLETLLDNALKAGYYDIYSDNDQGSSHSLRINTLEYVQDHHVGEGMEVVEIHEDGTVTLCLTSN